MAQDQYSADSWDGLRASSLIAAPTDPKVATGPLSLQSSVVLLAPFGSPPSLYGLYLPESIYPVLCKGIIFLAYLPDLALYFSKYTAHLYYI